MSESAKRAETTRMFESDFFEWFSRIHPATPFVTYLPVIAYFFYRIDRRHDLALHPSPGTTTTHHGM